MTPPFSTEDIRLRIRWYTNLRWLLLIALGITGSLPQFLQEGLVIQVIQNLSIIMVVLALNAIFWAMSGVVNLRYGVYQLLAVAQLVFDLLIVTGIVYSNGGIENIVAALYVIPIIMSGALLGRMAIYIVGIAAAAIYDSLLLLDYLGVISPHNILAPGLHTNTNYVFQTIFFAPVMLLAITTLTDFVSKFIRERTQLSTRLEIVSAEQAQIEAIIQSMGSALIAIDQTGKISLVNNAFEQLTGWKLAEVAGHDLDKVLPLLDEAGKKVDYNQRPLLKVLNSRPSRKARPIQAVGRYYYTKKNGQIFPFVGSIAQILLKGQVVGATTVFEDASNIKQMNQLKSNFIALASHQLKTPIAEIKGYAENMLAGITGPLNKRQAKYVKSIHEITLRSSELIAGLLDASVLEQGNITLNPEVVKLEMIIKKVIKIYQRRVHQKSLRLVVAKPATQILVLADVSSLTEAISNVVANAVNYASPNSTITIKTKTEGGYGKIFISDQGRGIDVQTQADLFKKSSILSSAPKAEGGTKVGLYLAKQLLALQKGDISVLSSTSKGTTMCIKVPLGGIQHDRSR